MAVKIRLKRIGAKKNPFYRIVVADARYPRDGRFIEQIGTYDPMSNPAKIIVDGKRALAWMKNGAQPTDTVRSLLKTSGELERARNEMAAEAEFGGVAMGGTPDYKAYVESAPGGGVSDDAPAAYGFADTAAASGDTDGYGTPDSGGETAFDTKISEQVGDSDDAAEPEE